MSTTLAGKRTWKQAAEDAEAFKALFPAISYQRWEFAGSLRRRRPEVADIEHVCIPAFGDIPGSDLFATPERINLLFHHLDALVAGQEVSKHIYGTTGFRWGEKYRGTDFRGFNHEIFCAQVDNLGPTLAIRTGPAEFSQRLVSGLLRRGMRNDKGHVWQCEPCKMCDPEKPVDHLCKGCDGTRLTTVEKISVPDERAYFALCGIPWVEPERRA